jgi:hypothetical protein
MRVDYLEKCSPFLLSQFSVQYCYFRNFRYIIGSASCLYLQALNQTLYSLTFHSKSPCNYNDQMRLRKCWSPHISKHECSLWCDDCSFSRSERAFSLELTAARFKAKEIVKQEANTAACLFSSLLELDDGKATILITVCNIYNVTWPYTAKDRNLPAVTMFCFIPSLCISPND